MADVSSFDMQLRIARLCLDCDELHDEPHCPVCASEAFACLTRWVPAPERRVRPRETTSYDAEVYKNLLNPASAAGAPGAAAPLGGGVPMGLPGLPTRLPWKRGLVGLTMLGVAGWLWKTGRVGGAGGAGTSPESTGARAGGSDD